MDDAWRFRDAAEAFWPTKVAELPGRLSAREPTLPGLDSDATDPGRDSEAEEEAEEALWARVCGACQAPRSSRFAEDSRRRFKSLRTGRSRAELLT